MEALADRPVLRELPGSGFDADLRQTVGYLVADRNGHLIGKVVCPMYATAPDIPDALSVRSGLFGRHRRLLPAETIDAIDPMSHVIGLRIARESVRNFL